MLQCKQTVRTDAEGMLQVMSGMEKQLADYAAKEEATAHLAKESKQKAMTSDERCALHLLQSGSFT